MGRRGQQLGAYPPPQLTASFLSTKPRPSPEPRPGPEPRPRPWPRSARSPHLPSWARWPGTLQTRQRASAGEGMSGEGGWGQVRAPRGPASPQERPGPESRQLPLQRRWRASRLGFMGLLAEPHALACVPHCKPHHGPAVGLPTAQTAQEVFAVARLAARSHWVWGSQAPAGHWRLPRRAGDRGCGSRGRRLRGGAAQGLREDPVSPGLLSSTSNGAGEAG